MRSVSKPETFYRQKIPRYDLIIVGVGPCGLAAALEFKQAELNYLHLESGQFAQTVHNFPTNICLFSSRNLLEIGNVRFHPKPNEPPTREEYLKYLNMVSSKLGLIVELHSKVVIITPRKNEHLMCFTKNKGTIGEAYAPNIVVASGGYYTPQLLGIPGEEQPNVYYYFQSELSFQSERVLVVGGRNSAIDDVITLVRKKAEVILSYRGARIPRKRIKPWLLPAFDNALKMAQSNFFIEQCRIPFIIDR